MKSKTFCMLVPMLLLGPAAVAAQSAAARGQGEAQAPQARIDAALEAVAKADIPSQSIKDKVLALLESKVAEGQAKRVPPERIAAAVEARAKSLMRASGMLKRADVEVQDAGELAVTADALDAGVEESVLIRLSREAPAERRTVALAVLADLVRLGHASEQALTRVSTAAASSAALANLHAEVASQLRLGGLNSTLDAAGIIRIP